MRRVTCHTAARASHACGAVGVSATHQLISNRHTPRWRATRSLFSSVGLEPSVLMHPETPRLHASCKPACVKDLAACSVHEMRRRNRGFPFAEEVAAPPRMPTLRTWARAFVRAGRAGVVFVRAYVIACVRACACWTRVSVCAWRERGCSRWRASCCGASPAVLIVGSRPADLRTYVHRPSPTWCSSTYVQTHTLACGRMQYVMRLVLFFFARI